jgi:hypothetical protein
MPELHMANGITQFVDVVGQERRSPIGEIYGEEITRACSRCASVIGHP